MYQLKNLDQNKIYLISGREGEWRFSYIKRGYVVLYRFIAVNTRITTRLTTAEAEHQLWEWVQAISA